MTNFPMQDSNFNICGSFCFYNAHLIYDNKLNGDASDFANGIDHVLKGFLIHKLSPLTTDLKWLICTLFYLIMSTKFL